MQEFYRRSQKFDKTMKKAKMEKIVEKYVPDIIKRFVDDLAGVALFQKKMSFIKGMKEVKDMLFYDEGDFQKIKDF